MTDDNFDHTTPDSTPDQVNPPEDGAREPLEDTKPKAPAGLHDAARQSALYRQLAAEEPPVDTLVDTAESPVYQPPRRVLLYGVVMLGTLCLCMMLVAAAGFAGYRDGLATNDARVTQTLATGIAQQYATGLADLDQGYAELAAARFSWIVETLQVPADYAYDSAQRLATARAITSYTPTPTLTATPSPMPTVPPTASPTPAPTEPATATLSPMQDPAYLYDQADLAMRVYHYEDAIEFLDALRAVDPTYRPEEAKAMLIEALTKQGKIYLDGANKDGEDKLARGVLLVYRANELGTIDNRLLGAAIFAEMFINAQNYVNGGYYAAALPILEELCAQNCAWGYPSVNPVTVRDLLDQAQAGVNSGS